MVDDLVLIAFTILLPITPAYILYKALPARASVKGPFKGLNIQLSGAFAGYFLLVLLIFGFQYSRPQKSRYEVWKVRGQIKESAGGTVRAGARLSPHPSAFKVYSDGQFELIFATNPGLDGGLEFPKLHIEHPDYQSVYIDLNEAKSRYGSEWCRISKSERARALTLDDSINLTRIETDNVRSYDRSGQKGQKAIPVSESEEKR